MRRSYKVFTWLLAFVCATALAGQTSAQELVDNDGCITAACHGDIKSNDVVHPPLDDECEICHEPGEGEHPGASGSEFTLSDSVPDLCYSCHDPNNEKTTVHEPVSDGDCLSCHSPHSSNNAFLLEEKPEELCQTCHDLELSENKVTHGPAASGDCRKCHEVHQSDQAHLLKMAVPKLCLNCHTDVAKNAAEHPVVHQSFADDCLGCHLPHGGDLKFLLAAEPPTLCFKCHDDIREAVTQDSKVHPPVQAEKKCLECHLPHTADNAALLVTPVPKLCLDCHGKNEKVRSMLEGKLFTHDPVSDGDCTACHSPHASNFVAFLRQSYPEGHYAPGKPESFAMCFDCHDSAMLTTETTTSETEFRDGSQNLHYVHVMREKGRSCGLCHVVHGSDNPHMIADKVQFGTWQMPLNYRRNQSGGSCLPGCHQERSYDREKKGSRK